MHSSSGRLSDQLPRTVSWLVFLTDRDCYWIGKLSKAVGREKGTAEGSYRLDWARSCYVGGETAHLFPLSGILRIRERDTGSWTERQIKNTERDRVRSILIGKKESIGRRADRSLKGKELRERQKDPNKDIRPDGRFKPPLVDASPSCSDATGSDPYTNGSRLGYREMVPESDGLIASVLMMRIRRQELSEVVNGCIVLERDTGNQDSDRVSAFCTGYGIEPSVDGSVMTGPRLVLDGGMVLLTGYGAVEPSMY
ncbi:hypothetical protein F2Q68_00005483 [Brassica cretica]|uniref:Uncharacterized protein n=1 Tax=Brassica cretica TaxID=69181 RepID=A0A8S9J6R3_BRACR|nr:hypothetical protein F2Q68_00005483 [Brassica cretica]